MQERLLDPSKPFFEKMERPEQDLLVTCMTAFFKLNHRSTVNDYLLPFIAGEGGVAACCTVRFNAAAPSLHVSSATPPKLPFCVCVCVSDFCNVTSQTHPHCTALSR